MRPRVAPAGQQNKTRKEEEQEELEPGRQDIRERHGGGGSEVVRAGGRTGGRADGGSGGSGSGQRVVRAGGRAAVVRAVVVRARTLTDADERKMENAGREI